jgi:hypothetical protein
MKERKPFLLRLDPGLYDALEQWAQQELRSVNGQIEFLLREAVNRRRGGKPPSQEIDRRAPERGRPT